MIFMHCTIEAFFEKIADKQLILFGASAQPIEAIERMKKEGLDLTNRVVAILDNSLDKNGKSFLIGTRKLVIQTPEYLKTTEMDKKCILVTSRFYAEIIKQLDAMEELKDVEVFAYPCMILSNEDTYENKYHSRITEQALFEYQEYLEVQKMEESKKELAYADMKDYLTGTAGVYPRIIPSVVLLHSNICSLKCENCCDLIPNVETPYYVEPLTAIAEIELLLKGVDKCIRVDLTDGEPFLYRELDVLLEALIAQPKVETIFMYTNATVCPNKTVLSLLKNRKCFLHISDYGLDEKVKKFTKLLDQYQINYKLLKKMTWLDYRRNNLEKREDGREWLRFDFLRCQNKKCSKPLFKNRLYGCMPAFRYADTGIFESEKDSVLLEETDSADTIWRKIEQICMLDFIETCQYCNFGNTGLPVIEAGR